MAYLTFEEAHKLFEAEQEAQSQDESSLNEREDLAGTIDFDAITDIGNIQLPNLPDKDKGMVHTPLPVGNVVKIFETYDTPLESQVKQEADSLSATLNALRNSLNVPPGNMKSLSLRSGLSYGAIDSDPQFANKKIESDQFNESMSAFMKNIDQRPSTWNFFKSLDPVEQLMVTSDTALAEANKKWQEAPHSFWETGYMGAAINAWQYGQLSREINALALKLMDETITDEDFQRLVNLRKAQAYGARQRDEQGLFERMVRGSVESVITPTLLKAAKF